jgi:hypothetical protein
MSPVESKVLGTVNAPYGASVDSHQLACAISSISGFDDLVGQSYSFFTEVSADLQHAFVAEMGVEVDAVRGVAKHLQAQVPFEIALAA